MRNRCSLRLKSPKVRQSWSKYNLYNLQRLTPPYTTTKTFFQQKWAAKSLARAYHGEQVREGQWERMFARRPRSVVPMDARYLARNDGSLESAGRGSGLEQPPSKGGEEGKVFRRSLPPTPYMQMTFAPLERRLDVAIFRAMFASSTRQARQFVVHGAVTVNGKKMQYPGYLLNPGDLFQVDPERVMFATGAPKDAKERRAGRIRRRLGRTAQEQDTEKAEDKKETKQKEETSESKEEPEDPRKTLKQLLSQAKAIMSNSKDNIPAKRRQEIRGFQRAVRRVLSRSSSSTVLTDNLEAQFHELKAILTKDVELASASETTESSETARPQPSEDASSPANTKSTDSASMENLNKALKEASLNPSQLLDASTFTSLSNTDLDVLKEALIQIHENPIDSTKPYATPWRPRDYMSAFAFIPRYLEVNHKICAAVYVRHPVARPGMAEVPTPFNETIGGAAFAWYLRRR
ncbi:mitochondrial 37S ribosomal protein nam9 [Coccidioides posadasii str. Silveira]|uniref:Small ribosomal subunit protein uS4m n=1 Tax=Coccidioides posadasii (strain RMSCC 757 / Silveira) TaxID=443226 RepID=E9CRC7_COCPS|nr:30S ribosomal subunit S4 [Coccidioides posadasii str. Silveira]QVM06196.1 mitochondrial 37S ribosomal protein nam9 [Coccidioides posadasii str. Silveira]